MYDIELSKSSLVSHTTYNAEMGGKTDKLVTRVPKLEVRRRRGELVDELRDRVTQPCVFVALQVRLEVFLRVTLVDLFKTSARAHH